MLHQSFDIVQTRSKRVFAQKLKLGSLEIRWRLHIAKHDQDFWPKRYFEKSEMQEN